MTDPKVGGGSGPSAGPGSAPVALRDTLLDAAGALGSAAEARWVLEHVVGAHPGAIVLARQGDALSARQRAEVDALVARRRSGEPLQYVLGRWPFRSLELALDRRVLIPRPETEVVVGYALDELARMAAPGSDWSGASDGSGASEGSDAAEPAAAGARRAGDAPMVVVDLGTGSGAVALALAAEGPQRSAGRPLEVWATDASADALAVARANAAALELAVRFAEGPWYEALDPALAGRVSLVVSNPPYVSEAEWPGLDPVVRDHEPRAALVAGPRGTEALDHLLEEGPRWLTPGGTMVLEIAPHQAEDVALRALVAGFDGVLVRTDLSGRARAVVARRW